jgi:serine/threonine protein kinase
MATPAPSAAPLGGAHVLSQASISYDPGAELGIGLTGSVRGATPVASALPPQGIVRQGSARWLDPEIAHGSQTNLVAGLRLAVKSFYTDSEAFPAATVDAFKKEIAVQCTLKHPNLVPVLGCIVREGGSKPPVYSVIMERMEASLFSRFVVPGAARSGAGVKLRALADVAQGLAFIHADGAVHGALTAAHVLLDGRSTAKVSAMGLLGMRSAAEQTRSCALLSRHADAGVTAQWRYSAPELLQPPPPGAPEGSRVAPTRHSDVFAFAIVAWEVAVQAVAYDDPEAEAAASAQGGGKDGLIAAIRGGLRPPLNTLPADFPPSFASMLRDAWNPDTDRRPTIYKVLKVRISQETITVHVVRVYVHAMFPS